MITVVCFAVGSTTFFLQKISSAITHRLSHVGSPMSLNAGPEVARGNLRQAAWLLDTAVQQRQARASSKNHGRWGGVLPASGKTLAVAGCLQTWYG